LLRFHTDLRSTAMLVYWTRVGSLRSLFNPVHCDVNLAVLNIVHRYFFYYKFQWFFHFFFISVYFKNVFSFTSFLLTKNFVAIVQFMHSNLARHLLLWLPKFNSSNYWQIMRSRWQVYWSSFYSQFNVWVPHSFIVVSRWRIN
jgi:hypothetical protein